MMNRVFVICLFSLAWFLLASCSLNPAWLLDPDGFDYDKKRGKITDTPRNRQRYLGEYHRLIQREAGGASAPWPTVWKGIFEALDESMDNPRFYQDYIIEERRKHGLPKLNLQPKS